MDEWLRLLNDAFSAYVRERSQKHTRATLKTMFEQEIIDAGRGAYCTACVPWCWHTMLSTHADACCGAHHAAMARR
eukprot:COSAG01_NODE_41_length_32446_cov_41.218877_30_plen_76_part_00